MSSVGMREMTAGALASERGMLRWLWLSVLVLALDQGTKAAAEAWLAPYEPLPVLPFFNLTLMYNTGAAFSFLSDASGWQRWLFTLVGLAVSAGIVWWLGRLGRGERLLAVALALILGGALGNVIDRVLIGHVVDFIQLYAGKYYWPAFNVADSAISVGAALIVIDALCGRRARA